MATVVNSTGAKKRIKAEEEFRTSNRSWSGAPGGAREMGNLPAQYHRSARQARYVVYSYSTPIGWVSPDGTKHVPDVGYSQTTGQHQHSIRYAWGIKGFPARGRELRPSSTGRQGGW